MGGSSVPCGVTEDHSYDDIDLGPHLGALLRLECPTWLPWERNCPLKTSPELAASPPPHSIEQSKSQSQARFKGRWKWFCLLIGGALCTYRDSRIANGCLWRQSTTLGSCKVWEDFRLRVTPLYQPEQWVLGVEPEHLLPALQKFIFQGVSSPVLPWSPLEGNCALFLKAYAFPLQPNHSANVTMTHPHHPQTPGLILNIVTLHMLWCMLHFSLPRNTCLLSPDKLEVPQGKERIPISGNWYSSKWEQPFVWPITRAAIMQPRH